MKKLLLIVFICGSMLGITIATDQLGDCTLVLQKNLSSYHQHYTATGNLAILSNIFGETEFERAFENLKTICCDQTSFAKDNTTICQEKSKSLNISEIPHSVFFFDHVFDILMRKMEGDVFYGTEDSAIQPDPIAQKRKQQVKTFATQEEGSSNDGLGSDYRQRTSHDEHLLQGFLQTPNHSTPWMLLNSDRNKRIIEHYSDSSDSDEFINLKERYLNTCNLAAHIYLQLNIPNDEAVRNRMLTCNAVVLRTLQKITQQLMIFQVQENTTFLKHYLTSYQESRLKRIKDFEESLHSAVASLKTLVTFTPQLTAQCN